VLLNRPEREKKNVVSTRGSANDGQDDVARKKAEIESAEGSVDRVTDIAVQRMMQNVADQEHVEKAKAVIIDARCAAMRRARMNVKRSVAPSQQDR